MKSDDFELVVLDTSDMPLAYDYNISLGEMVAEDTEHAPMCPGCGSKHTHENIFIFEVIIPVAQEDGTIEAHSHAVIVPLASPFGQALSNGNMTQEVQELLDRNS